MNEKQLDLRSQIKILDVGAGTGRYSVPLAEEGYDCLLYTSRSITQVIFISDTFSQFAGPLMKKLGWPTIFCNELEVARCV